MNRLPKLSNGTPRADNSLEIKETEVLGYRTIGKWLWKKHILQFKMTEHDMEQIIRIAASKGVDMSILRKQHRHQVEVSRSAMRNHPVGSSCNITYAFADDDEQWFCGHLPSCAFVA